jgi:hypothetical protein
VQDGMNEVNRDNGGTLGAIRAESQMV